MMLFLDSVARRFFSELVTVRTVGSGRIANEVDSRRDSAQNEGKSIAAHVARKESNSRVSDVFGYCTVNVIGCVWVSPPAVTAVT